MSDQIWIKTSGVQRLRSITSSKDPDGVEFIPARHYNELIDWMIENSDCEWRDGAHSELITQCGQSFEFASGDVEENNFKSCPFCGHWIDRVRQNNSNL